MYGLLIAKNLSTRSRYSHCLCVSANTKIKLKLKQLKLSDWTSAMFCWLFVCSAIDFIFSLLFEFSVNNCEKKVKLVKHLHSMQMVRNLTTAFRLCRSYSPVRLCALCFYPVCFFGAVSFPRFQVNSISSLVGTQHYSSSCKFIAQSTSTSAHRTYKHWKIGFHPNNCRSKGRQSATNNIDRQFWFRDSKIVYTSNELNWTEHKPYTHQKRIWFKKLILFKSTLVSSERIKWLGPWTYRAQSNWKWLKKINRS